MWIVKNKFMKRFFIFSLLLIPVALFAYTSKKIPEGHSPQKADALALEVMNNLNLSAWEKTNFVKWEMFGHQYQWFKNKDSVVVKWKKYEAFINLNKASGEVYEKGERVEDNKELIEKAIKNFNNDSFWLSAHYKMLDPGTSREIVDLKKGKVGLKVFYSSGGSTPGDTFLWILEEGKPIAFKMWVSIIPFGGMRANWKKWKTTETGAMIALTHKMLFFNVKIKDLELR
jgi:hypothetical protein